MFLFIYLCFIYSSIFIYYLILLNILYSIYTYICMYIIIII